MIEVTMTASEALMAAAALRASKNDFVWPLAGRLEKLVERETADLEAYKVETTEIEPDCTKSFMV